MSNLNLRIKVDDLTVKPAEALTHHRKVKVVHRCRTEWIPVGQAFCYTPEAKADTPIDAMEDIEEEWPLCFALPTQQHLVAVQAATAAIVSAPLNLGNFGPKLSSVNCESEI